MFISFTAKNFRSIKGKIVLDLQSTNDTVMKESAVFESKNVSLLKSTAIYGPNASGKSNIMKAFVAFKDMVVNSFLLANTTKPLPNQFFELCPGTENKPSFFEFKFLIDNEIYIYGFEIDKQKICKEWLKQEKGKKTLFNRVEQTIETNKNYFKEGTAVLKKQTVERALFLSVLSNNNATLSRKIIQTIQNISYISGVNRGETMDDAFGMFLAGGPFAEKMKNFIAEADFGVIDIEANQKMVLAKDIQHIPDKFKELLFKEDSKIAQRSLKFLHKKYDKDRHEVGTTALDFFSQESEGTQQMFALSSPILKALSNGTTLLIDEIDSSLHPILCQYLISLFNSPKTNPHNAQLVFTTHDISLLDEKLLRRDQIYFTDKNKYGETQLYSLSDVKERKGVNFLKRYMEGRYNALPYIKPFEDLKFNKDV